ncbi:MAG: phosphoglycerate kinase, partial [Candidatus Pacebacteria bacterium]|nr:phosphoglycerate kinase [Candidatus Paceibacterota bacterium]
LAAQKKVLIRADYNVPFAYHQNHTEVADDNRIKVSLPTLKLLVEAKAKLILMTHLGRPGGQVDPKLSAQPVAKHLQKLIDKPVKFVADCVGPKVEAAVEKLQPGEILLLENLRFYPQEKQNNAKFSKQLASLADLYVNEAFSTAHRDHASITGVSKLLPSYAGLGFEKEVEALSMLMENPKRPFVMVVGGAKISDKVAALTNLTKIADVVLVGGGVANNFLKADGYDVASSYLQDTPADLKKKGVSYVEVAKKIIAESKTDRLLKDGYIPLPKIVYPIDVIAARSSKSRKTQQLNLINGYEKSVKHELMYLDIGEKTIRLFQELILQAKTVFWNGPMGVFEKKLFAHGTQEIARAIAKSSATTIIGGGDTIAAIRQFDLEDRYDYVSAAGGASLEFLSGKVLPGVKAVQA